MNSGCLIDYRTTKVTPQTYISILKGNSEEINGELGRVLNAGPTDTIFLGFFGHG